MMGRGATFGALKTIFSNPYILLVAGISLIAFGIWGLPLLMESPEILFSAACVVLVFATILSPQFGPKIKILLIIILGVLAIAVYAQPSWFGIDAILGVA